MCVRGTPGINNMVMWMVHVAMWCRVLLKCYGIAPLVSEMGISEMGFKHRPEMLSVTMSPQIRAEMLADLHSALTAMVPANARLNWAAWAARAEYYLSQQLASDIFADGKVFTNADKPHADGTVFQPYMSFYDSYIHRLHRDFVVTTADKLSDNLVVVCKKHYVESVLQDLDSGQFYTEVAASPHTSASDLAADSLRHKIESSPCTRDMYGDCSTEQMWQELLSVFPYESATACKAIQATFAIQISGV